ncbi:secretory lipase-domain-containing protein [Xylariales sp. PMI_506]|nr:secretory lipase-domain-containing protein [Xylariales sp. PMI_506]
MLLLSLFLLIAALLGDALARPEHSLTFPRQVGPPTNGSLSGPIPPTEDPWYTAPDGWEQALPGDVLRIRVCPGNLTQVVPFTKAAYNIMYRTEDSSNSPSWAVTTLLVPLNPVNNLMTYLLPYDSVDLDASPSYIIYDLLGNNHPANLLEIEEGLIRDWYVSVPDYETYTASFTAGITCGHATLDSIRAVLRSGLIPNSQATKYAIWGYSASGTTADWAGQLQDTYAPELNITAISMGGLTPKIWDVMKRASGTVMAGLVPPGILGLASQYPDVMSYILSRLNPTGQYNASTFLSVYSMTLNETNTVFALENIFNYFQGGEADLEADIVQNALSIDGTLGTYNLTRRTPFFIYQAIHDQVAPINDTDALVTRYCWAGANLLYRRNNVGGHKDEQINGRASAVAFMVQAFNGNYSQPTSPRGCTVRTVNATLGLIESRCLYITTCEIRPPSSPGITKKNLAQNA